jgi:hypothetical protein
MTAAPRERLEKTLARVAREPGLDQERLRRWVSFLALCGVLELAIQENVIANYYLKGGVAMELRFAGAARATEIATAYFSGESGKVKPLTDALTDACKGIYKALAYAGTWGMAALSKMPTSGIDFKGLSEAERRQLNVIPAMLYHGVNSEPAVVMRMNSVPRSIAQSLGNMYAATVEANGVVSATSARTFLKSLSESDWNAARPAIGTMTGSDYQTVWATLSGESLPQA